MLGRELKICTTLLIQYFNRRLISDIRNQDLFQNPRKKIWVSRIWFFFQVKSNINCHHQKGCRLKGFGNSKPYENTNHLLFDMTYYLEKTSKNSSKHREHIHSHHNRVKPVVYRIWHPWHHHHLPYFIS